MTKNQSVIQMKLIVLYPFALIHGYSIQYMIEGDDLSFKISVKNPTRIGRLNPIPMS